MPPRPPRSAVGAKRCPTGSRRAEPHLNVRPHRSVRARRAVLCHRRRQVAQIDRDPAPARPELDSGGGHRHRRPRQGGVLTERAPPDGRVEPSVDDSTKATGGLAPASVCPSRRLTSGCPASPRRRRMFQRNHPVGATGPIPRSERGSQEALVDAVTAACRRGAKVSDRACSRG
jgi:hypothetical protein